MSEKVWGGRAGGGEIMVFRRGQHSIPEQGLPGSYNERDFGVEIIQKIVKKTEVEKSEYRKIKYDPPILLASPSF